MIAEKIRIIRQQAGLSVSEFAEKVGITADELVKIESGETVPTDEIRIAISQAFSLESHELMPDADEQTAVDIVNSMEQRDSLDNKLPYNPYADKTPRNDNNQYINDNTLKRKMYEKASMKLAIIPTILCMVLLMLATAVAVILEMPEMFIAVTFVFIVLLPVFQYLYGNKVCTKLTQMLGNYERLVKWFNVIIVSSLLSQNALSGIITNIISIIGFNSEDSANTVVRPTGSWFTLVTLVVGVMLTRQMFEMLDDISSGKENKQLKSFATSMLVISVLFVATEVVNLIVTGKTVLISVISILVTISCGSFSILWLLIVKQPEKFDDVSYRKIMPLVILISYTVLSVLSTAVAYFTAN